MIEMLELNISPNFTIDDIHKIREYNYEMTKNMSREERNQYYKKLESEAKEFQKRIDELRQAKKAIKINS